LPQLDPIRRNQSLAEAEETEADGETEGIEDKDNEEEEVTNLLLTTANTASISQPLNGSTTAEEEEAVVAPTPSVKRATALTPATAALTLATTAGVRLAAPLTRTSTTAGLRETRPGKWVPHSHFPGPRQYHQQQKQQLHCQCVE
jgi:hypothetical protein